MAYAAAIYGLMNLAKCEAGENVLIMNATGGAGLAAIKNLRCYEDKYLRLCRFRRGSRQVDD